MEVHFEPVESTDHRVVALAVFAAFSINPMSSVEAFTVLRFAEVKRGSTDFYRKEPLFLHIIRIGGIFPMRI